MKTRLLLGASGFAMLGAGLAGTFLPHEIVLYAGLESAGILPLVVQLHAAMLLAFGALNWMSKDSLIGGIYARPLVIGNLLHFLVGALALMKRLPDGMPPGLLALTTVYAVFAAGFGATLFTSPVKAQA